MLTYSPRLPILWDSGFFVADFVAVHSCEGSGGFTPHFSYASGASVIKEESGKEFGTLFPNLSPVAKLLSPPASCNKTRCKLRARSEMQMNIARQHRAVRKSFFALARLGVHAVTPQDVLGHL